MAIATFVPPWREITIDPKAIIADPRFQPRVGLKETTVTQYAAAMGGGQRFPAIKVATIGKGKLYVIDGFHRLEAALRSSRPTIAAEVAKLTVPEAVAIAIDANTKHGLQFTQKDKYNAFLMYHGEGLHLKPDGKVKTLAAIRADLDGIAYPNTISAWLRKANIQTSDQEVEHEPWTHRSPDEQLEDEDMEERETLSSFSYHLAQLEAHYACLSRPGSHTNALEEMGTLLSRLKGEAAGSPLDI